MSKSNRVSIHATQERRTIVAIHARGAGNDKVTIGFYTGDTGRRIPVNTPEWDSAESLSRYALEAGLPLDKVAIQRERGSLDIWMP